MIKPALYDVVELLIDIPDQNLRAGTRGAIVHQYADENYEVEFTNEAGETTALCALPLHQFILVWRAETQEWIPVTEQIAQIATRLPEETRTEVLNFARFLSLRIERSRLAKAR